MSTITQIAQRTKQPYGGLIRLKDFKKTQHDNFPYEGDENYNINPGIFGNAIDYGSRLYFDVTAMDTLERVSSKIDSKIHSKATNIIINLKEEIKKKGEYSLSSIKDLCDVSYFDTVSRSGQYLESDLFSCNPDDKTCFLINLYIKRTISFFNDVGPVISTGFTFEDAHTQEFTKGDGDFLTKNTIWDLKVLKANPNAQRILQVACYYAAAKKSKKQIYKKINSFGIYNPRKNISWIINEDDIDENILNTIYVECMGYDVDEGAGSPAIKSINQIKSEYKKCPYINDVVSAVLYLVSFSDINPLCIEDDEYITKIGMDFLQHEEKIERLFNEADVDISRVLQPKYMTAVIEVRHRVFESLSKKNKKEANIFRFTTFSVLVCFLAFACFDDDNNHNLIHDSYFAMVKQKEEYMKKYLSD